MKTGILKIGCLGAGAWGSAIAALLSKNGHKVSVWDRNEKLLNHLDQTRTHPKLQGFVMPQGVTYVPDVEELIGQVELIVESVTAEGLRPVFKQLKKDEILSKNPCPIVITSKGIEQKTGLLFPEVLLEVLGEKFRPLIGCVSGPSLADEVVKDLPTSVVCSAYVPELMHQIRKVFNGPHFRVYPNADILGVCFGGAMKNAIAIACGISDGLGFGNNTKAALMTRGLHEIRKLAITMGSNSETLNGLSGLGDLFVTCTSPLSRNYRFGWMIAKGEAIEAAKEKIGMVIEGTYTCVSAVDLARKKKVPMPITEAIYGILYEGLSPKDAVKALLQREIKEEHL